MKKKARRAYFCWVSPQGQRPLYMDIELLRQWALPIAISASFLYAIFMLLSGRWTRQFTRWGYLPWFRWFLLILQILTVVSLFLTVPPQRLGTALGIIIVLGAIFTLSRNFGEGRQYVYPVITLIALLSFLALNV